MFGSWVLALMVGLRGVSAMYLDIGRLAIERRTSVDRNDRYGGKNTEKGPREEANGRRVKRKQESRRGAKIVDIRRGRDSSITEGTGRKRKRNKDQKNKREREKEQQKESNKKKEIRGKQKETGAQRSKKRRIKKIKQGHAKDEEQEDDEGQERT
ncbi:hypothetical protein Tco_0659938 [Tanacetum coccineum]